MSRPLGRLPDRHRGLRVPILSVPADRPLGASLNPCGKSARPTGRDIAVAVSNAGLSLDNKLLASLPRDHFDRLAPHLSPVTLQQGLVLFESGDEVDQIYFPHFGMLSLLVVLRDGKAIETATVGREGVAGAMAGLGLYKSLVRVVVQMPFGGSKIAATHFRTIAAGSDPVRNLCIRYNEVLLSQARVTAACNALHPIEARFCRWLLQSADRAASDTVELTQEFLAEMLGVRRTSVTEVASRVQNAGAITYSRGVIRILDRPALMRMSCECYQTLLDQSALLG
ncbi:MAG: Crp/Fnr family transcriptional regulator [Bradyrhizobium sp.]|nr:MAG: Crp/Fnr family transcriptional regulator [Bradyrhizobium sp.]